MNKRIDTIQALQIEIVFKRPHAIWPSLVTSTKMYMYLYMYKYIC